MATKGTRDLRQDESVPLLQIVRAVLMGAIVFALMSLGSALVYFSSIGFLWAGRSVTGCGIGLLVYALFNTLRARLNSPWLVTLLTAFTLKSIFQVQAITVAHAWIALYVGEVDQLSRWITLLSGAAVLAMVGQAGIFLGLAPRTGAGRRVY